jgi:hypothetical protein
MARHPLSPEERLLDYSKYWYWTQPAKHPLSQELLKFPIAPEDTISPYELNRLLEPGYMNREQGVCVLPDGTGYSATYIWMPGVTVDMIDWWYVWHFNAPPSVDEEKVGNLRYKIWCPQEHVDTGFDDEASRLRAIDESIPMRARRYGSKNFIKESLDGGETDDGIMLFHAECYDPVDFGFDPVKVNDPANGTIIAAYTPIFKTIQIYQYRPYAKGVELRLRNFYGYEYKDGKIVKIPGYQADTNQMIGSCQHVLSEYPNLARFLPELYAEESFKPIDAY